VSAAWAETIVGQDEAVGLLERLRLESTSGRFLLFWGPEGVGKRTVARCFADVLLDARGRPLTEHPDFHVLQPERSDGTIGVDEVRQLGEKAFFPPLKAEWRVWLLFPCDRLTLQAANALLRLLEELPQRLWVIGVTNAPARVPATLRSRALKVRFGGLPVAAMDVLAPQAEPAVRASGSLAVAHVATDPAFSAARAGFEQLLYMRPYDPEEVVRFVRSLQRVEGGARAFFAGLLGLWATDDVEIAGDAELPYNDAPDAGRERFASIYAQRRALLELIADLERHVNPVLAVERTVRALRAARKRAR